RGIRLHAAGQLHQPVATPPTMTAGPPVRNQATPTGTAGPTPVRPPAAATAAAQPTTGTPGGSGVETAPPGEDHDGHPGVAVGQPHVGAMSGAGLLASLLFAMLTAERRRQRSFFAAGQEPPLPRNGKAERELRAAQQPADGERLDAALRSLGH